MQYGIKALLGILSVVFMEVAVVRLKNILHLQMCFSCDFNTDYCSCNYGIYAR